jgi:hypothetical protein
LPKINTLRPMQPIELLTRLQTLFPGFGDDELMRAVGEGERGFHGIMLEFSGEFRAEKATEAQLVGLVDLIEQAVTVDDEIENAIATCFLEHLHQIDQSNTVHRRLSGEARRRTRA